MNWFKVVGWIFIGLALFAGIVDFMRCPLWLDKCEFTGIPALTLLIPMAIVITAGIILTLHKDKQG